ncbi:MAG: hypothetical protein ACODAD_00390 [Planctomycetota bacterium]
MLRSWLIFQCLSSKECWTPEPGFITRRSTRFRNERINVLGIRDDRTKTALFGPRKGDHVPLPYTPSIEIMDAHGGWIASAIDLVRFASAFDAPPQCKILDAETLNCMFERTPGVLGFTEDRQPKASYYACGWLVRPIMGSQDETHGTRDGFPAPRRCWCADTTG